MTVQDRARAWSMLERMVAKIQDPVLRNAVIGDMAMRAKMEWGYCPSTKQVEPADVELEDWQRDFLEQVKIGVAYGVCTFSDDVHRDNKAWMTRYVRRGGMLSGIPDDVRCEYVDDLYWECLKAEGEELMGLCDYIEQKMINENN